jgi:hypothetical protein
MQAENLRAGAPGLCEFAADAELVDDDDGELPPQPAVIAISTTAATTAATPRRNGERAGRVGVMAVRAS